MTDDTTITPLHQPGSILDPLSDIAREGARRMLAAALRAEAASFVAQFEDERLPDGRHRVVRHGTGPERTIQTGIGPIPVQRQKVRSVGEIVLRHRSRTRFEPPDLKASIPRQRDDRGENPKSAARMTIDWMYPNLTKAIEELQGTASPSRLTQVSTRPYDSVIHAWTSGLAKRSHAGCDAVVLNRDRAALIDRGVAVRHGWRKIIGSDLAKPGSKHPPRIGKPWSGANGGRTRSATSCGRCGRRTEAAGKTCGPSDGTRSSGCGCDGTTPLRRIARAPHQARWRFMARMSPMDRRSVTRARTRAAE